MLGLKNVNNLRDLARDIINRHLLKRHSTDKNIPTIHGNYLEIIDKPPFLLGILYMKYHQLLAFMVD